MGNCLSKIPEGAFQLYKEALAESALNKDRIYIRRYDDLLAIGCHVCKQVCKTLVTDRFPLQACNLEWEIKASRYIDRTANGNTRAICGLI